MIENCTITNVDVHGRTIEITGDGDEERQFMYIDSLGNFKVIHERARWYKPDCRWLPEPVEVGAR